MKTGIKNIVLIAFLIILTAPLWAQSEKRTSSRIPLLNEDAPSFTAESTNGTISFPRDYGSKWKILFSHPGDFTPVCTTELLELAQMQQDFKELNVALAVVSVNSLYLHEQWVKSMENILNKDPESKPVKINFPLIDDSKFSIGWKYGMLTPSHESFKAVRGVFIIDPDNKIQAVTFYPMNVGRSMAEIKRMVIALQTAEKNAVLIPADWKPGEDVLLPNPESVDYYDSNNPEQTGLYDVAGYLLYKKLNK